jgi:protein phosphatase
MRLEFAGLSHVGRVRKENQDAVLLLPRDTEPWLLAVADGMGGMAGGAEASRLALEVLTREVSRALGEGDAWGAALRRAVEEANRAVWRRAQAEPALRGMGTTVVAALVGGRRMVVANVGDSRAYSLRGGELRQITEDHSLVQEEVAQGLITPEQARTHAMKNVLTRAVGAGEEVEVDLFSREVAAGEVLLLCSDGLHGVVPDAAVREILLGTPRLEEAARRLVEAANQMGGPDNVSVVLARVEEVDPEESEPGTDTQRRRAARQGGGGLRGLWRRLVGK